LFESAELGHRIDKAAFKKEVPPLREALLQAQADLLRTKKMPVVILVSGVEGAGKGETVNILSEWMDPRHIQTHALDDPTDEERDRPYMWRFWRKLPPRGKIGVFVGSWYRTAIVDRAFGRIKNADLDQAMERIIHFEKMLSDEGALILKFWLHLSKDAQRARLKKLESSADTRWRVTDTDWRHFKRYDTFRRVSERALRQTSTFEAPWIVVEGTDPNYRYVTIGKAILDAVRKRLDAPEAPHPLALTPPVLPAEDRLSILSTLDMSHKLGKKAYSDSLAKYEKKLNLLTRHPRFRNLSVVAVFEGPDAAGKGGAIRRITGALDARIYRVIPIAAPTEEEREQPYLWRFWRNLPRTGRIGIFDRSWYGRVLVERVEKFCRMQDWMRAYSEINDFEEQLVRNHTVVLKYWVHITRDEQLARFKEREKTGFKRFKLTEEDWRNRKKWDEYEIAACDMIDHTGTEIAPWTLVEANDKQYARIKVMKTMCDRIESALKKSRS
jgi:polyphosphate:AMP phosphotransferase